jgi:hypothetical protein
MEYWPADRREKWVLGYWCIGRMIRRRRKDKNKMDNILIKTQYSIIPQFHHSIIEAKF